MLRKIEEKKKMKGEMTFFFFVATVFLNFFTFSIFCFFVTRRKCGTFFQTTYKKQTTCLTCHKVCFPPTEENIGPVTRNYTSKIFLDSSSRVISLFIT